MQQTTKFINKAQIVRELRGFRQVLVIQLCLTDWPFSALPTFANMLLMGEKQELKEGRDYYINEDGFKVMTANYLIQRGRCCQSGCKHCPYGYRKKVDPNIPAEFQSAWDSYASDEQFDLEKYLDEMDEN